MKTIVELFETAVLNYPDNVYLWEKKGKKFEGTTYTLNLNFTSLAHLKAIRLMLDNIIEHPSFKNIVED